jgi:ketosteroid isomerase-like protein
MSEGSVAVVRRLVAAWNERDLETLIGLIADDAQFMPFRAQLEGAVYRGPEGVRQFARDASEDWEFLHVAASEYRDVGGERVLVLGHMEARGQASGVDLRVPAAWVIQVRGDKVTELRAYTKYQDAFDAVGVAK